MREKPPNYYEVLAIHYTATDREIKTAHRKLIKAAHPDSNGENALASRLNVARDVLLNPAQRAMHDEDLRNAGFIFQSEESNLAPQSRIIRNVDAPHGGYRTPASDHSDFIEVEVDLDEYDDSKTRPLVELATRLFGTLFWFGAAVGCYYVAPFITRPFNDVTTFGGDMIALIAGIFRLVVYIAIPACIIMGGYVLFHRRQD